MDEITLVDLPDILRRVRAGEADEIDPFWFDIAIASVELWIDRENAAKAATEGE